MTEAEDFDIRTDLAAALKCWNRLSREESTELVAFVAALRAQPASSHYPKPTERDDTEHGVDYFTKRDMDDMWKQGYRHGAWAQPDHSELALKLRHAADEAEKDYYGRNEELMREAANALEGKTK